MYLVSVHFICTLVMRRQLTHILFLLYTHAAQVNGIARRIGMYRDGLAQLGCTVDSLHPDLGLQKVLSHVNPWYEYFVFPSFGILLKQTKDA